MFAVKMMNGTEVARGSRIECERIAAGMWGVYIGRVA